MRRYRNYDGEPEVSYKSEKPCRACVDVKTFFADSKTSPLSSGHKLPGDCPLDKNDLGRASWSLLHTMAAYYPDKPNSQQQSDMRNFMDIFSRLYPCKPCADDLVHDLKDEPPVVSSRQELSQWMCRLHNKVNNKLGKQLFDCSRVDERWLNGSEASEFVCTRDAIAIEQCKSDSYRWVGRCYQRDMKEVTMATERKSAEAGEGIVEITSAQQISATFTSDEISPMAGLSFGRLSPLIRRQFYLFLAISMVTTGCCWSLDDYTDPDEEVKVESAVYHVEVRNFAAHDGLMAIAEELGPSKVRVQLPTSYSRNWTVLVDPSVESEFKQMASESGLSLTKGKKGSIDERTLKLPFTAVTDATKMTTKMNKPDRVLPPAPHPFFENFRSYYDMETFMIELRKNFSQFVDVITIGPTRSKGNPILALKLAYKDGPRDKPTVWIDSLIHGRDWITGSTSLYFAHRMLNNPVYTRMLKTVNMIIVPSLNPDGYIYTYTGDTAHHHNWYRTREFYRDRSSECWGTDMDQNFPIGFTYNDTASCARDTGLRPFSVRETQAVEKFFNSVNITMCITLRAFGQMVARPYASSNEDTPHIWAHKTVQNIAIAAIRSTTGSKYSIGSFYDHGKVNGSFVDWAYQEKGIIHTYALFLPPGPHSNPGHLSTYRPNVSLIPRVGLECSEALSAMINHVMQ